MAAAPLVSSALDIGRQRFAGYAALFGVRDLAGDVIRPGAFAASLARGGIPLLLAAHDRADVIGTIEHVSEDDRGLRVIGAIDRRIDRTLPNGLSFGYRARDARPDGDGRELITVDLYEISLTPRPLQPNAKAAIWWFGSNADFNLEALGVWG